MADILIRGMEMPRDCPMCILAHFNKLDEFTGCDAAPGKRYVPHSDYQFWNSSERPSWCPLLPLPEGHGRLIDANELELDLVRHNGAIGFELIGNAPTIVPAEGGGEDG
jgi:hypothetical protein